MSVQNYSNYSNEMLEKLLTETTNKGEDEGIKEELKKRWAEELFNSVDSSSKKEQISSDNVSNINNRKSISEEIEVEDLDFDSFFDSVLFQKSLILILQNGVKLKMNYRMVD